jgi:Tfp pilus assembly protein PilX
MKLQRQYLKGGASLYVVIFTTLLLGIITLGFIRIILSEAQSTTDYDLSQSAYDSALAGIEDAKVALLAYQDCLAKGDYTSTTCKPVIDAMLAGGYEENCDIVREMLGRAEGDSHETIVQSESGNTVGKTGATMDQAYTCVKIAGDTDDYISDLSDSNRTRIVPLRSVNNTNIKKIRFSWFSDNDSPTPATVPTLPNALNTNRTGYGSSVDKNTKWFGPYDAASSPVTPPAVELQLIQTANSFNLSQLNANQGDTTDRGTLMLAPSTSGATEIGASKSVGFPASADKAANNPVPISCVGDRTPYRCSVTITLPAAIGGARNSANTLLRVSVPYGQPATDFQVEMLDDSGNITKFNAVQARVDSTGRANDLFRRVEARIEMVDIYFPYPEFTLTLTGDGSDESINKNFWVTLNSWSGQDSGSLN